MIIIEISTILRCLTFKHRFHSLLPLTRDRRRSVKLLSSKQGIRYVYNPGRSFVFYRTVGTEISSSLYLSKRSGYLFLEWSVSLSWPTHTIFFFFFTHTYTHSLSLTYYSRSSVGINQCEEKNITLIKLLWLEYYHGNIRFYSYENLVYRNRSGT